MKSYFDRFIGMECGWVSDALVTEGFPVTTTQRYIGTWDGSHYIKLDLDKNRIVRNWKKLSHEEYWKLVRG